MSRELLVDLDLSCTILISAALVITLPLATFVYSKLLFSPPYSANFTFKLIVFNGLTALLSCTSYLVIFQISSFEFANPFYSFLITHRAVDQALRTFDYLLNGLALHSALFVALNRLKTLMFLKKKGSDKRFVIASILASFILSSLRIIDQYCCSNQYFEEMHFGGLTIFIPQTDIYDMTLRTIVDIQTAVVCGATFSVNLLLAFLLARRQNHAENVRMLKAERGLIITSFVSFAFYTLYYVNNGLARYLELPFCAYAQFLFLGLASLTPFWCLIIFATSIRYFIIRGLLQQVSPHNLSKQQSTHEPVVITATI